MKLIFTHPEHGTFEGTRRAFAKAHPELHPSGVTAIVPKEARRKHPRAGGRVLAQYKGWSCALPAYLGSRSAEEGL